ncbi:MULTISPECIES: nitroreductase/quinone reductase family protein [Actinomadura]|uniref:nitroreductase/quinone reductase family protein n=1 Tax=Actinomadura TaxID=1988 RepID=UPI000408B689|nr:MULTISPECIES: nitroreductase/quinone reductase family protein [Actinomadura]RSN69425.1 nitroreductase family deazaflavin-dependent oxidoreductase [Actinomadura sp. WAC 06369]
MDFNRQVIEEFRANDGRVGGMFEGGRLLLLTTTGARSGARHTVPLGYLPDGPERLLVIASAGGAPRHPAWFRNLVANPRVTIETGAFTQEADASVLDGEERDRLFARAVEADAGWAEYEEKSGRTLPVVALTPIDSGPPRGPQGQGLKRIHGEFRRELDAIRREVAASGTTIGAQLRVNCLTFCHGLEFHHGSEDRMIFPTLERNRPELAPVIDLLREEHEVLKGLLAELRAALASDAPDPAALAADVDRLVAEVNAHLDHEEERLVPVLDEFVL